MSNMAGKAYAMNVITPIRRSILWINRLVFWVVLKMPCAAVLLKRLIASSSIYFYYAHWVVIGKKQFPYLDTSQPAEDLRFNYLMFFSNFNWRGGQYAGLPVFLHKFIQHNQIETTHYYSAYPLATSRDIQSARKLKQALLEFNEQWADAPAERFHAHYNTLLNNLKNDLGDMRPASVISMAAYRVQKPRLHDLRKVK